MRYLLMHKNIEVALMDINIYGDIYKVVISSQNKAHLPLGGQMNMMKLHEWWNDRAVPKSRDGSARALKKLGYTSTNNMLVNNLALSLTDCYWIKPFDSNLTWEKVSLYRNDFTDAFGDLTFDEFKDIYKSVGRSATSQGELSKKWSISEDGRRLLIKGNWGSSYQQSLNEVLASEIHKMQNKFPYVQYYLTPVDIEGGEKGIGCYSYNFCTENIEFISAWEILQLVKIKQNESWYNKFCDVCVQYLGMNREYVESFLGYEIMTDFIISNTDRHMNNIGVLRNPDTLEYYGFAPIYDSGNSMFFRSQTVGRNLLTLETHSFVKKEVNLLKYVKNTGLVNLNKLPSDDFLRRLYLQDISERHYRIEDKIRVYNTKIYYLDQLQHGVEIWKSQKYR